MSRGTIDYGIDAPGLVRGFLLAGLSGVVLLAATAAFAPAAWAWRSAVLLLLALATLYPLGMGGFMLFESRIGKVRGRERLLDRIAWRGDERVLDVGCGRGLMLVGAAKRLTTGRATGIDIWQASDQSANGPEGALGNAAREGVADRVEVATADMRKLPFADATFDVIVSHWVVHNLDAERDRALALTEMSRVLRPAGTILLADIAHRAAYATALTALGFPPPDLIVSPLRDAILTAVSFGSFRPFALLAHRPG